MLTIGRAERTAEKVAINCTKSDDQPQSIVNDSDEEFTASGPTEKWWPRASKESQQTPTSGHKGEPGGGEQREWRKWQQKAATF